MPSAKLNVPVEFKTTQLSSPHIKTHLLPTPSPSLDAYTLVPLEPATNAVFELLEDRYKHQLTGQSKERKLKPHQYLELLRRLDELPSLKNFVEDKCK